MKTQKETSIETAKTKSRLRLLPDHHPEPHPPSLFQKLLLQHLEHFLDLLGGLDFVEKTVGDDAVEKAPELPGGGKTPLDVRSSGVGGRIVGTEKE